MNHPSQITDPLETGVEEEHHNWNDAHFLEFPTVHQMCDEFDEEKIHDPLSL